MLACGSVWAFNMDWTECSEIEQVPGKMSGQPVVKGTRILAQTVIDNFEGGSPVEEIHENYPSLSVDKIRKLIAFAQSHSTQPVP
jgi:uncharacterized protein (DUF433 family)